MPLPLRILSAVERNAARNDRLPVNIYSRVTDDEIRPS